MSVFVELMDAQHITSRQNARVKEAVKLRDRRARERQKRFVIDGGRELGRAILAGIRVVEIFICDALADAQTRGLASKASARGVTVFTVTAEVFEKLCFGDGRDGVVAVAEAPDRPLAAVKLPRSPLVAVLEGLEKPGNVGAVLRSADGAGIDAVIIADPCTDLFNPNTIRASLGTVFRNGVAVATSGETLAWLQSLGLPIIAARPDATRLYTETDCRSGAAIVLGSEARGLSEVWSGAAVEAVKLPMHGMADSLNVSATAAVLFYEAQRQRRPVGGAPN